MPYVGKPKKAWLQDPFLQTMQIPNKLRFKKYIQICTFIMTIYSRKSKL